jgi:hypothetical protein
MDYENDFQTTILMKLDELMQIATAIEKSSRPLSQMELTK